MSSRSRAAHPAISACGPVPPSRRCRGGAGCGCRGRGRRSEHGRPSRYRSSQVPTARTVRRGRARSAAASTFSASRTGPAPWKVSATCGRSRGPCRTSAGSRAGGAAFPRGSGRDGLGTRRRRRPGGRLGDVPSGSPSGRSRFPGWRRLPGAERGAARWQRPYPRHPGWRGNRSPAGRRRTSTEDSRVAERVASGLRGRWPGRAGGADVDRADEVAGAGVEHVDDPVVASGQPQAAAVG